MKTNEKNRDDRVVEGVLELCGQGHGFLRDPVRNYSPEQADAFVPASILKRHRLREGVLIKGATSRNRRGPRLEKIDAIDGRSLNEYQTVQRFDELTAINPLEQIKLEVGPQPITMRVIDLLTPIGKGQRALIVAPPRTGKTMLLQEIATSISRNHPEIKLIMLLIDERPEEVTEMRRMVKGEVIASSIDQHVENHIRLSQLAFERGKRLAEAGEDVVILLDSVTRLARAFNKCCKSSGRATTGGLDLRALDNPKRLFGAARRFEEGGSLTVIATALIHTGSQMDEVIFQEFKGTGNMELVLNRDLADRRIWPAIDFEKSGTRREEKLLAANVLRSITTLRKGMVALSPAEVMEQLTRVLSRFQSNDAFLARLREEGT